MHKRLTQIRLITSMHKHLTQIRLITNMHKHLTQIRLITNMHKRSRTVRAMWIKYALNTLINLKFLFTPQTSNLSQRRFCAYSCYNNEIVSTCIIPQYACPCSF